MRWFTLGAVVFRPSAFADSPSNCSVTMSADQMLRGPLPSISLYPVMEKCDCGAGLGMCMGTSLLLICAHRMGNIAVDILSPIMALSFWSLYLIVLMLIWPSELIREGLESLGMPSVFRFRYAFTRPQEHHFNTHSSMVRIFCHIN